MAVRPAAAAVGVATDNQSLGAVANANFEPAGNRQGKKCSNIKCPDHARYKAATCKLLWSKCNKHRTKFGPGMGGLVYVCPNANCKDSI